jgi:hypothetical protein
MNESWEIYKQQKLNQLKVDSSNFFRKNTSLFFYKIRTFAVKEC